MRLLLGMTLLTAACVPVDYRGWTCDEQDVCSQGSGDGLDASLTDRATPPDAAQVEDAGPFDAGQSEAGTPDIGLPEAGAPDAGPALPRNCSEIPRASGAQRVKLGSGREQTVNCVGGWTQAVVFEESGCTREFRPWSLWRETQNYSALHGAKCAGVAIGDLMGVRSGELEFEVKFFRHGNDSISPNWSRSYTGLPPTVWDPLDQNSRMPDAVSFAAKPYGENRWVGCEARLGPADRRWIWSVAGCSPSSCTGDCTPTQCGLVHRCASINQHGFAFNPDAFWGQGFEGEGDGERLGRIEIWVRPFDRG